MRRWGLIFALLVSAGLNAGILATLWVTRGNHSQAPRPQELQGPPPVGQPGDTPPLPEPERPPLAGTPGGPGGPPYGPPGSPVSRPHDLPGHPGPDGPAPGDGSVGGETAEVEPEPGTLLPVPSTPPPRLRELADRLGVSGEPRERFFALQLKMMATMRDGRQRIQQLRRAVRVEMLSDRPDRTKIEASLAALQNAQLTLERQTVRTILDTREILDGEAERQYLDFITRIRMEAGEPRPDGRRPQPGDLPRQPQNRPINPGTNQPGPWEPGENRPNQDPRMNRPAGPQGGGFGRRNRPQGNRMPTFEERMERRRRFEEWRARQGGTAPGTGAPPPLTSEAPPPPG